MQDGCNAPNLLGDAADVLQFPQVTDDSKYFALWNGRRQPFRRPFYLLPAPGVQDNLVAPPGEFGGGSEPDTRAGAGDETDHKWCFSR